MGMGSVRPMTHSYRLSPDQFLEAIKSESARFGQLLADADPASRVPSCPDWDAADLLWHLTEVQWFWSTLVAERPRGPSVTEGRRPARPAGAAELSALFRWTSDGLVDALESADDTEAAWTWLESDQTVGFIRRRQAHEVLIHRVDAEQVVGEVTALDPALATDGVDEAVQIMFGGIPGWASFRRDHGPVGIRTSDTAAHWVVDIGRQSGVEPESGEPVDEPTLAARDDDPAVVAELTGTAGNLDSWLWGRADPGGIARTGDAAALTAFDAVIRTGID